MAYQQLSNPTPTPNPPSPPKPVIDWDSLGKFIFSIEELPALKYLSQALRWLIKVVYFISGPTALAICAWMILGAGVIQFQGCNLPGVNVTVPNVVGSSQLSATQKLNEVSLNLGGIVQVNHDSIPLGNVISQNPGAGISVPKNSSVDIVVSLGRVPSPPPPPPPPAPIPVSGLRVLIVYDDKKLPSLPEERQAIIFSPVITGYLTSKCPKGADGKTPEFRFYSKGSKPVEKVWVDAMARPRQDDFWMVVSNGKSGWEGLLPKNVDEAMTILKKYGE